MSLKTFVGFRGVAISMAIDKVKFFVVAKNNREAEALHEHILPGATEPFNPTACKKAILIEANNLPERAHAKGSKPKTIIIDLPDEQPNQTDSR